MDRLQQLKRRLENLWAQAEGIRGTAATERRDLTDAELKDHNEILDDIDKAQKQLEAEERAVRTKEGLDNISRTPPPKTDPGRHRNPGDDDGEPGSEPKWRNMGEFLQAVRRAENRGEKLDSRLTRAAAGLSEGVGSDGGFLVNKDFSSEILQRTYETGQLVSRARHVPISAGSNGLKLNAVDETSRVDGSQWGGVTAYWQNEADTKLASKPKFRQMEWSLKKLIGLCYATDELVEDATALESVIRQAFAKVFAFKVDSAILNGTGAGQPFGILNSGAVVTVAKEVGQGANTILFENVQKMWSRMYAGSRPTAAWFYNQDIEPQLAGMSLGVGAAGQPVFLPPGGISGAPYATIFGRPAVAIEQASTLGTVGDLMLLDLQEYLVIDKGGIQEATSIHVRFVTDETAFRFVLRIDGQPLWNSPLTPAKGSNTLSPFVVLATRA